MIPEIETPNSQNLEMIVLGGMLSIANGLEIGVEALDETDFDFTAHRSIFQALEAAYRNDKPVDVHLIGEELKRHDKLKAVGGMSYLTTLVQYAGTAIYVEEYVAELKKFSNKRKLAVFGHSLQIEAMKGVSDADMLLERAKNDLENISSTSFSLPIECMNARLERLNLKIKKCRGLKHLGLCQRRLQEIDDKLLGLRKLILLAAAPNAGKTALTNQFSLDILMNNQDACVAYFSLEMSADEVLTRMLCNLAQMDYQTYVLGSSKAEGNLFESSHFSSDELKAINNAEGQLKEIGTRLQIVDRTHCPFLNASSAIAYAKTLKEKTGCSRVLVVVDYLQVWPLDARSRFFNEIEIDKWRMGEILKIRDALNDDPIIVISEARKPQKDGKWGADLSDVMGSARITYSPDAVMLLSQLGRDDLGVLLANNGKLGISTSKAQDHLIDKFLSYLEEEGITICKIDLPKGRDGMQRFSLIIEYHFKKNVFKMLNFTKIKRELECR